MKTQKANKILDNTTTFVIPKGVTAQFQHDEFTRSIYIKMYRRQIESIENVIGLTKCDYCPTFLIRFKDEFGQILTVDLPQVLQVADNTVREAA